MPCVFFVLRSSHFVLSQATCNNSQHRVTRHSLLPHDLRHRQGLAQKRVKEDTRRQTAPVIFEGM